MIAGVQLCRHTPPGTIKYSNRRVVVMSSWVATRKPPRARTGRGFFRCENQKGLAAPGSPGFSCAKPLGEKTSNGPPRSEEPRFREVVDAKFRIMGLSVYSTWLKSQRRQ